MSIDVRCLVVRDGRVRAVALTLLLAGLFVGACSDVTSPTASTAPSTPTPAAPSVTETFAGVLQRNTFKFYSFSMPVNGTINVTLLSVGAAGVNPATPMSIGLGTPAGTDCSAPTGGVYPAGPDPQVTATKDAGTYCAVIADVGNLAAPAAFTVLIAHP